MSREKIAARYMMGTTAVHQLGDISRNEPDICVVFEEDKENYYGNWVTGFGFIDVRFPKETTRELTDTEKDKYDGMNVQMGSGPIQVLHVKDPVESSDNAKYFDDFVVIKRPDDTVKQAQLQAKLQEYKERIKPCAAPELQADTICKIAVLEKVLSTDEEVRLTELADEMMKQYGSGFSVHSFNNACAVIADYCETGGQHACGGTGLPEV